MSTWTMRLGALGLALAVSLVIFLFWGRFGAALVTAMQIEYAPKPAVTQPHQNGEVNVFIFPAKPKCDKDHPCK